METPLYVCIVNTVDKYGTPGIAKSPTIPGTTCRAVFMGTRPDEREGRGAAKKINAVDIHHHVNSTHTHSITFSAPNRKRALPFGGTAAKNPSGSHPPFHPRALADCPVASPCMIDLHRFESVRREGPSAIGSTLTKVGGLGGLQRRQAFNWP
ncbi:hypothetical protein GGTG_06939 [Gaeumannomyces tritici R3-111a-1]|uniref:Uncharacterized protein n=1 Tax=Gaeumannomyces tritici (strain R3-111a-1) TaxID=644352 RepID=J3P092_GAET3|nr:hypothetical protein GGTG_06939 [Gaeumannomyces tritici R3-111a-1]EJT77025.1 hypothetical protein GGTG_06939 [Gaeumannomyces tritici R3-111a-1]